MDSSPKISVLPREKYTYYGGTILRTITRNQAYSSWTTIMIMSLSVVVNRHIEITLENMQIVFNVGLL